MRIQRLSSTHFRNLTHEPLLFSPGVNIFVGDNGHGKTNLLEALHIFKFGRSFRTSRDTDLVNFTEPFCRIEVTVDYSSEDVETLSASIERDGTKRIKKNDEEVAKLSELVGHYPCVLFGPQDLALASGFPAERRRFLDMTGSMTDRVYLSELRAYRRVLTQRNASLKSGVSRSGRSVWDGELVRTGCALIERREDLIRELSVHIGSHIQSLNVAFPLEVVYESDISNDLPEGINREEHFAVRLADIEEEETRRRTTLVGPHRDDVKFVLNGRDLRRFGSQGQRRLLAILLRLAELSYMEEKLGEPCVLLLDDLFSELDDDVGEKLKGMLDDRHQLFVTSPTTMDWGSGNSSHVFRVCEGKISV
ncbi:MAG: DNA replication/repair protein RecF [Candidatus Latescibacterota bacterium]|nr:MAG: DNA replication/repair protein RecF [Candidatus Latescibacterota bacterium]